VDERGTSLNKIGVQGPIENESCDAIHLICDWICRVRGEADIPLIVGGKLGPALAARIGAAAEYVRVLIPDFAGHMAEMGKRFLPAPIQAELVITPAPLDSDIVRDSATRVMEALSDKLARSGYDFDDVICETLACVGWAGDHRFLWETVGPVTRVEDLVEKLRSSRIRPPTEDAIVELRSMRAIARVDTRHWELPMGETIASQRADEKAIRHIHAEGPIVGRTSLEVGAVLSGPITIRAADHFTVVPRGWTATSCRAGGIQLEYNGPAGANEP
jgi:N-methylhydantoinase A/oxoprolinase/acetone carboxylase beta subunit